MSLYCGFDGEENRTDECKPTGRMRSSPGCLHGAQLGQGKVAVMLVWPACLPYPASKAGHKTWKGIEICILAGLVLDGHQPGHQSSLLGHLLHLRKPLRNVWEGAAGWDELLRLSIPCSLLSPEPFPCITQAHLHRIISVNPSSAHNGLRVHLDRLEIFILRQSTCPVMYKQSLVMCLSSCHWKSICQRGAGKDAHWQGGLVAAHEARGA